MKVQAHITIEATDWEDLFVPDDEPVNDDTVRAAAEEWANAHSFNVIEVHEWTA